MKTPSPEAMAASKALHRQQWYGLSHDEMIAQTAATIDRHFDPLIASLTRQPKDAGRDCPECDGTGRDDDAAPCNHCGGDGKA